MFKAQFMLGKDLELIRISWKAKRLNFGRFMIVTSHATWNEWLQRASVTSRHPRTTRHTDKRSRRFWIEQFSYFGHNFLYRHPNEVIQVALKR